MPRIRTSIGLVIIAAVALTLRVGAVVWLESYRQPFTYEHGEIAQNLLAGRGFSVTFLGVSGATSQQAPFYPALLATAYQYLGIRTPMAFLAVQLLQCLAGAATCLLVTWIAWNTLPASRLGVLRQPRSPVHPSIGWVAGAIAAVHPAHVYAVTHLQVAVWATFALTLLLALATSPHVRGWRGAMLIGLVGGCLLLVEPILALALPIVAAAFGIQGFRLSVQGSGIGTRGSRARAAGQVLVMTAVSAIVISPWLWRNARVHGDLVFVKSTFGYAFWQGNNPSSWGTDKIPKPTAAAMRHEHDGTLAGQHRAAQEARHETLYIDDMLLKPGGYAEFAGLSEPQRSRLLGGRAWQFIREQPWSYVNLCLRRLRYFLLFDETNPKAASLVYRAATVCWLGLALPGLWITRRHWRWHWPLAGVVAAVTLFHTLTIVSARFRLPIEPLTFVWCAATIVAIAHLARSQRQITS